jgi:hypothetical protein
MIRPCLLVLRHYWVFCVSLCHRMEPVSLLPPDAGGLEGEVCSPSNSSSSSSVKTPVRTGSCRASAPASRSFSTPFASASSPMLAQSQASPNIRNGHSVFCRSCWVHYRFVVVGWAKCSRPCQVWILRRLGASSWTSLSCRSRPSNPCEFVEVQLTAGNRCISSSWARPWDRYGRRQGPRGPAYWAPNPTTK